MSPASAGPLEVERYTGACLISSTAMHNRKPFTRHYLHYNPPGYIPFDSRYQNPGDVWAGGFPLVFTKRTFNPEEIPLARLAVHTQGFPLILTGRNRKGKVGRATVDSSRTEHLTGVDALSIASDESSGSNLSETSLPRIIKPRKRRKKDRKPRNVVGVSPQLPDDPGPVETESESPKLHHRFEDVEVGDSESPSLVCQCRYCDPAGLIWDVDRHCYSPFLTAPHLDLESGTCDSSSLQQSGDTKSLVLHPSGDVIQHPGNANCFPSAIPYFDDQQVRNANCSSRSSSSNPSGQSTPQYSSSVINGRIPDGNCFTFDTKQFGITRSSLMHPSGPTTPRPCDSPSGNNAIVDTTIHRSNRKQTQDLYPSGHVVPEYSDSPPMNKLDSEKLMEGKCFIRTTKELDDSNQSCRSCSSFFSHSSSLNKPEFNSTNEESNGMYLIRTTKDTNHCSKSTLSCYSFSAHSSSPHEPEFNFASENLTKGKCLIRTTKEFESESCSSFTSNSASVHKPELNLKNKELNGMYLIRTTKELEDTNHSSTSKLSFSPHSSALTNEEPSGMYLIRTTQEPSKDLNGKCLIRPNNSEPNFNSEKISNALQTQCLIAAAPLPHRTTLCLAISTEIVTSPNGHRDLEIRLFASPPPTTK